MDRSRQIQRYCCCTTNLECCKIIAIFYGISRISMVYAVWDFMQDHRYVITFYTTSSLMFSTLAIFVIIVAFECFFFFGDVLLLIGTMKKIKGSLFTWNIFTLIAILHLFIMLIILKRISSEFDRTSLIVTILFSAIRLGFFLWAILTVKGAIEDINRATVRPTIQQIHL